MKLKLIQIINKCQYVLVVFCIISTLAGCKEISSDTKEINNISDSDVLQIPIYPESRKINRFSINKGKIKGVNYEIKECYPANGVLIFYETEMKQINLIPYVEEYYKYSDRKWQRFIDSTKGKDKYVAQLMADWVNPEKTKRIRLILNYYWNNYDASTKIILTNNENLFVTVQILPFLTLQPPE
ncbi:MAG: hypothetical protein ABIK92_02515 [Pseudomonadota bacterium]